MSIPKTITVSLADECDRAAIYAIRHDVDAEELKQHPGNIAGRPTDPLDDVNQKRRNSWKSPGGTGCSSGTWPAWAGRSTPAR